MDDAVLLVIKNSDVTKAADILCGNWGVLTAFFFTLSFVKRVAPAVIFNDEKMFITVWGTYRASWVANWRSHDFSFLSLPASRELIFTALYYT